MAHTGSKAKTTNVKVCASGPMPAQRAAANEQATLLRMLDPSAIVHVVERPGRCVLRVRSWS